MGLNPYRKSGFHIALLVPSFSKAYTNFPFKIFACSWTSLRTLTLKVLFSSRPALSSRFSSLNSMTEDTSAKLFLPVWWGLVVNDHIGSLRPLMINFLCRDVRFGIIWNPFNILHTLSFGLKAVIKFPFQAKTLRGLN